MCDLERAYARMERAEAGAYDIPYDKVELTATTTRLTPQTFEWALDPSHSLPDKCMICETDSSGVLIHTMEAWAGEWHSACGHSACAGCLLSHIDGCMEQCMSTAQLRIPCFVCHKTIPQRLVLAVSALAAKVADAIDTGTRSTELIAAAQSHGTFGRMHAEMASLEKPPLYPTTPAFAECKICCDTGALAVVCGGHLACRKCVATWAGDPERIAAMFTKKALHVPCLFAAEGCACQISEALLISVSPAAKELAPQLVKRKQLQASTLFPAMVQVDCRDPACVGIGYLGFETVMCFICEEQWPAETFASPVEDGTWEAYLDSSGKAIACRKCPKCEVRITKDGGCDHMTCGLCRHQWWWSTGKAYGT